MNPAIGIRREDKNEWEKRVPLVPQDVTTLIRDHGFDVLVQPSEIRVFSNDKYLKQGAKIQEDLSTCSVVFGVKEIPLTLFKPGIAYIFFAHVIKGQKYNMPMLKRMMELKCHLIDYEKVTDRKGRRLIVFGWHAGAAGMIESLWAFGQRLDWEETANPFHDIKHAYQYSNFKEAENHLAQIGKRIETDGVPTGHNPLIVGFAGYGNASRGAQDVFDYLPHLDIEPARLQKLVKNGPTNPKVLYKVVFKEEHIVKSISNKNRFELQDYYEHPEKYRSRFNDFLPYLSILMNTNYWDGRYPRLVTKAGIKELFSQASKPKLRVIGDISCDVEGSIECNTHITDPGDPVYVYNPFTGKSKNGIDGVGPVILAVDNLPCEIPEESSRFFSSTLMSFVPAIANADYSVPFDQCQLPPEIKNAVILYQGQLTPRYKYIEKYM
jgi:saccharopine dehydrogenase (NAD+, L-lysine-forming)